MSLALRRTLKTCLLALSLSLFKGVHADIFVYERPDGSKLISDQRQTRADLTLIKTYQTTPYRSGRDGSEWEAVSIKSQYDALIVNTALQHDVDPALVKSIVQVESAFDRFALSRVGARGLMQLMPTTAEMYDLHDDLFDARKNIRVGTLHLSELLARYNADVSLALAAYNAGEGAVKKYGGIPPYEETQNYVAKVLKLYRLYRAEL